MDRFLVTDYFFVEVSLLAIRADVEKGGHLSSQLCRMQIENVVGVSFNLQHSSY